MRRSKTYEGKLGRNQNALTFFQVVGSANHRLSICSTIYLVTGDSHGRGSVMILFSSALTPSTDSVACGMMHIKSNNNRSWWAKKVVSMIQAVLFWDFEPVLSKWYKLYNTKRDSLWLLLLSAGFNSCETSFLSSSLLHVILPYGSRLACRGTHARPKAMFVYCRSVFFF